MHCVDAMQRALWQAGDLAVPSSDTACTPTALTVPLPFVPQCHSTVLQEALWRVAAFADEGADVLFIDALASVDEMAAFGALGKTPKVSRCTSCCAAHS